MGSSLLHIGLNLGIELIYPMPDGTLLVQGFDISRMMYVIYPGLNSAEELAHRRHMLLHALEEAHRLLVRQLRERPREHWPRRIARVVRWLGPTPA